MTITMQWNVAEIWIFERRILRLTQEKWWVLITVRNISGVHQTKYYYDSVKKSKFLCSYNSQIDKKSIIQKKLKKIVQEEKLIQALLISFYSEGILCSVHVFLQHERLK